MLYWKRPSSPFISGIVMLVSSSSTNFWVSNFTEKTKHTLTDHTAVIMNTSTSSSTEKIISVLSVISVLHRPNTSSTILQTIHPQIIFVFYVLLWETLCDEMINFPLCYVMFSLLMLWLSSLPAETQLSVMRIYFNLLLVCLYPLSWGGASVFQIANVNVGRGQLRWILLDQ